MTGTNAWKTTAWTLTLALHVGAGAQPLEWTSHGTIAEGSQFDAVRGADSIHLVSSRYYEIDSSGAVVVNEEQGDPHHGELDFPPAIAVEGDGTVHIVTRGDGDYDNGFDIRYRRRASGGGWDRDYYVGERQKRNYTVSVTAAGGAVYVGYGAGGDNVWGDLRFFEAGSSAATAIGDISGIWRADTGVRMRSRGGGVFFGTGKCDPDGRAYLLWAPGGGDLVGDLAAHTSTHSGGTDRKGFADVYVDGTGHAHFTYGAYHTVHYNRFDENGQKVYTDDIQLADGLGDWHMSAGLSAVAASDNGDIVVAVMLLANGSQTASGSDLLWTYSLDGGASWAATEDTGWNTNGGEGRLTPRLVAIGNEFFLFYKDSDSGSITLATMYVEMDADGDGFTSDEDCDDDDPHTYPGGIELCDDGIDNDCDGATDAQDTDCGGTGDDDTGDDDDDDDDVIGDDDSAGPAGDDDGASGCGCRTATGQGAVTATGGLLLLGLLLARRLR